MGQLLGRVMSEESLQLGQLRRHRVVIATNGQHGSSLFTYNEMGADR